MENKEILIKCPKCGREYLPSEIYLAKEFLGEPKNIIKNEDGKLLFYEGTNMNLLEEFECDCGCLFKVKAKVDFKTEIIDNTTVDFDDSYTTSVQ